MTVNIPQAGGLPAISDPPNWLDWEPDPDYNLDEKRWFASTKRTSGSGASDNTVFRAIHAAVNGQKYIYLSFRVKFAQSLSAAEDSVFLGLQKHNSADAMVIQMDAHTVSNDFAGPPSSTPPSKIANGKVWTRQNNAWKLVAQTLDTAPAWIEKNARAWCQNNTDMRPADPNCRWAIQLRIPVTNAGNIIDPGGPNLGADFDMWYYMRGGLSNGAVVIYNENRTDGNTTSEWDLGHNGHPVPSVWEEALLASGPASFGGITIFGNGTNDIVVKNTYGEGVKIANGQNNTFIARPRNYRPPGPGNDIAPTDIDATFRIANWGSVVGNPNQVDWATGTWDYVPGNGAPGANLGPVLSGDYDPLVPNSPIPTIPAGSNPDGAKNPIQLAVTNLTLGANKSPHQCIFVTLSGANLNFLAGSAFKNMDFEHGSLLERQAEINIVGLKPLSAQPRDVYLAIEKVNMLRNTPASANEGHFLESSLKRLIERGGSLAKKLRRARELLSKEGDFGSSEKLGELLNALSQSLSEMKYNDRERGLAALEEFIAVLGRWLTAVKPNESAAKQLSLLFEALSNWLLASGLDAVAKLLTFITRLSQWLSSLNNDSASPELAPSVLRALRIWLSTLADGPSLASIVETFEGWFSSGRSTANLPAILEALSDLLTALSAGNSNLRTAIGVFADGVARWLKGYERLDVFVDYLSRVDLTESELDQLFPTFRVHVYHDTGERVTGMDGKKHPVLQAQSSFGIYVYHEGNLEGWQTSIQGAQRIDDNLYLLAVPNNGVSRINVRIQAVEPGEERMPEDKIVRQDGNDEPCGCLCQILRLFGIGKKK